MFVDFSVVKQHILTAHIDYALEHSWRDLSSEFTYIIRLSYQHVVHSAPALATGTEHGGQAGE